MSRPVLSAEVAAVKMCRSARLLFLKISILQCQFLPYVLVFFPTLPPSNSYTALTSTTRCESSRRRFNVSRRLHRYTMAPPNSSEIIPLEMMILVGHKLASTSSTRKKEQSYRVLLPSKSSELGVLEFCSVDFVDGPSPNHGLLQLSYPRELVTFDRCLEMFTATYGKAFSAKGYNISDDNVIAIFFNYTKKNGERDASPALTPTARARFSDIFRSASTSTQPISCRCGCDQHHHGPSIILVLNGASWDKRMKNTFDIPSKSYLLAYKDDLKAKMKALPLENLVPIIVKQEILSIKAKKDIMHYVNVEERHLEMQKEADRRYNELGNQIQRLKARSGETEHVRQINSLLNIAHKERTEEVNDLIEHNEQLTNTVGTLTARNEELTKKAAALTTQNEELTKENNALTAQIRELLETNNNSDKLLPEAVRPATVAHSAEEESEQGGRVTRESYDKMEAANQVLNATVLELEKQLANMHPTTAIPQVDHDQQVDVQTPRTNDALNADLISTHLNQGLLRNFKIAVRRDIGAMRGLDKVKVKVALIRLHIRQRRFHLAMHLATELNQRISTFPLPVQMVDVNKVVTNILAHVARQAAAANSTATSNATMNGDRARDQPPRTDSANAFNFLDFDANSQQPSEKRKLSDTLAITNTRATDNIKTVSAPRDIFAGEKIKPAVPPKGLV